MNLKRIFETVSNVARSAVAAGTVVPSESRGVFRRKPELSARRLDALRRGHDLEVTTQRMIVALAASGPKDDSDLLGGFANELQVGAGVYIPTGQFALSDNGNRRIDLARLLRRERLVLPLTEMKGSRANDSPRAALEQVFENYCWIRGLRQLSVTPFDSEVWREVNLIQIQIMAPADWFARHGGVPATIRVLSAAKEEIQDCAELCDVKVCKRPIVLDVHLWSANRLLENFDTHLLEVAIQRGGARDALEVLRQDKLAELQSSLNAALQQAASN
jgi:hypothetical protein